MVKIRFNKRITFVSESDGGFNPNTGMHDEPSLVEVVKPCNLSTLGVDRSKELFGEIDTLVIVARLQHPFLDKFDYALIDDKKFKVTRQSDYRKGAFYLEGSR